MWEDRGSSHESCAPWSVSSGAEAPKIHRLVLVSGGGLCGNAGQIIAASFLAPCPTTIIEPDIMEIPNLNRSVGVGINMVGHLKLDPLAAAMTSAGFQVEPLPIRYEEWSASGAAVSLRDPGAVVLVGVDQVATRLEAQADWPSLLVNGATGGLDWTVSAHPRGAGGCVGCFYGAGRQPYAASRRAMACATPLAATGAQIPDASYPFVSVCAAAAMVATMMHAIWEKASGLAVNCRQSAMNTTRPQFSMTKILEKNPRCLLVCGPPALQDFFRPRSSQDPLGKLDPVS
jgi:hypothetical protein